MAKEYADNENFVKETITPAIEFLVGSYKDGQAIGKDEIEKAFKRIMDQMVSKNLMTQKEMDDYLKPQKIEKTERVKIGTKMVEENPEDRGLLNQLGNFVSGKKSKMVEEPVYETRKSISDASQFQEDMEKSIFKGKDKVDAPNLTSLKDKLLNAISRVCTSFGFDDLAKACRKGMSVKSQEKLNKVEAGRVGITKAGAKEAKVIGEQLGNKPKGKPIGKHTQNTVETTQKSDRIR